MICPPGKSMIFLPKGNRKRIELVIRLVVNPGFTWFFVTQDDELPLMQQLQRAATLPAVEQV